MSEQEKTKIIDFTSHLKKRESSHAPIPQKRKQVPARLTVVDFSSRITHEDTDEDMEERKAVFEPVIPSVKQLYDLDSITINGLPMHVYSERFIDAFTPESEDTALRITDAMLLHERAKIIRESIRDRRQRELPYRELVAYTLGVVSEIGDPEENPIVKALRSRVVGFSHSVLGPRQTTKLLERFAMLEEIHANEHAKKEHEDPENLSTIFPFTIIE